MTLNEFCAEMRKDLDRFEENWKKQQAIEPDKWPNDLGPGDWYDQLLMFLSQGDDS